jgi:hypothetical protein
MASQTVRKKVLMVSSRSLPAGENVDCEFNLPPAPVIYPARLADRCQLALLMGQLITGLLTFCSVLLNIPAKFSKRLLKIRQKI